MSDKNKLAFDLPDELPPHVRRIGDLKQMLDDNNVSFPSPTHCMVFQPDEVDPSIEWYKKNFPGKDRIIFFAGVGEYSKDPEKDKWEIRTGWFDVESKKRVDKPSWLNEGFQIQLIRKATGARDINVHKDGPSSSKIILPGND